MSCKEQPAHLYPFFFTNAFKTYKLAKVTSRTSVIRNWMFRWTIRKRATKSPNRLLNGSASGGNILWKNLGGSRLEDPQADPGGRVSLFAAPRQKSLVQKCYGKPMGSAEISKNRHFRVRVLSPQPRSRLMAHRSSGRLP